MESLGEADEYIQHYLRAHLAGRRCLWLFTKIRCSIRHTFLLRMLWKTFAAWLTSGWDVTGWTFLPRRTKKIIVQGVILWFAYLDDVGHYGTNQQILKFALYFFAVPSELTQRALIALKNVVDCNRGRHQYWKADTYRKDCAHILKNLVQMQTLLYGAICHGLSLLRRTFVWVWLPSSRGRGWCKIDNIVSVIQQQQLLGNWESGLNPLWNW